MAIDNKPSSKKNPKPRKRNKPKSTKVSKYPKRSQELPKNTLLLKIPLPREPLPPRHSSLPKIVYISSRTPFVSAIKRIRRHLSTFDKQTRSSIIASHTSHSSSSHSSKSFYNRKNNNKAKKDTKTKQKDKHVIVRATGRAIEKLMGIGVYLQSQDDIVINIRTGTVEATDDVVTDGRGKGLQDLLKNRELERLERRMEMLGSKEEDGDGMDVDDDEKEAEDGEEDGEGMEVDEEEEEVEDDWTEVDDDYPSRKRYVSMLEIVVRKKELPLIV